jgi:hypothetical protein
MTVAEQIPRVEYLEDASTVSFPVPFRYRAPADIKASRRSATGPAVQLVFGTDYSVSPGDTNAGGTLTVTAAAVDGTVLEIWRETPRVQDADYTASGPFKAESHEAAMDRAILVAQENDLDIARTARVPSGEPGLTIPPAAERKGKYWLYDPFTGQPALDDPDNFAAPARGEADRSALEADRAESALLATELVRDQAADLVLPENIFVNTTLEIAELDTAPGVTFKLVNLETGIATVYLRTEGGSTELYSEASTAALAAATGSGKVGFDQIGGAAEPGTVAARLRESPSPFDPAFGVVGENGVDDTAAWQIYFNYCRANGYVPHSPRPVISEISDTLVLKPYYNLLDNFAVRSSGAAMLGNVTFLYTGLRDRPALEVGTPPDPANPYENQWLESRIELPSVFAAGFDVSWPGGLNDASPDCGIYIHRMIRDQIVENWVAGFTSGIIYEGSAWNTISGKHIADNKFGRVYTSLGSNTEDSFTNENTVIGGRIGHTSKSRGLGFAALQVFTWDKVSSYRGHNTNRFINPCLESSGFVEGDIRVPVWCDGAGVDNRFEKVRMESCNGPIMVCDGGGSGDFCRNNQIDLLYASSEEQQIRVVNKGGAVSNYVTGLGAQKRVWSSGEIASGIKSSGASTATICDPRLFFLIENSPAFPADIRRTVDFVWRVGGHRNAILLNQAGSCRIAVAIDASFIKEFTLSYAALLGFSGRPNFFALDAAGSLLSGLATETEINPLTGVAYADEPYVKGTSSAATGGGLISSGGGYGVGTDSETFKSMAISVRDEVKTLIFSVTGASRAAALQSMEVIGHSAMMLPGSAFPTIDGMSALHVFSLLDDSATIMATANPATAGRHGYYARGESVGNANPASGQPQGWICTTSGWLASAWVASTIYDVPGELITSDGGKIYELVTPGTAAGSGGPTGSGSWIEDGTCVWAYIGVKAAFAPLANLP